MKDHELALAVAAAAGWKFRANPKPRSPVLGTIVMKKADVELQVDVVRSAAAGLRTHKTIVLKALEIGGAGRN